MPNPQIKPQLNPPVNSPNLKKCLTPKCAGPGAHHGLCPKCWGKAKKLIEAGQTTMEELAALGLIKEPEAAVDPFTAEFNRKKKETA